MHCRSVYYQELEQDVCLHELYSTPSAIVYEQQQRDKWHGTLLCSASPMIYRFRV